MMFQLTTLAKPQLRLRSVVVPAMVIILLCLIKVKVANSSEADLLKATITVTDDNALQLKAYYGRNMPGVNNGQCGWHTVGWGDDSMPN